LYQKPIPLYQTLIAILLKLSNVVAMLLRLAYFLVHQNWRMVLFNYLSPHLSLTICTILQKVLGMTE